PHSSQQRLEVSLAKTIRVAATLNHIIDQRRPIKYRLAEQLQEIPVSPVAINQNSQLLQIFHVLANLSDASRDQLIIAIGHVEKIHAAFEHAANRRDDIVGKQRDMR